MTKIHIWIGTFKTEKEFKQYVDQSKYMKAWQMYNNGDENYVGDEEPDKDLRSNFCKEINIDFYDEDFIVFQFNKKSDDITQLISIIPADANKLIKICKQKIEKGNSLIYYTDEEVNEKDALKCKSMTYIGVFEQDTATVVGGEGLQGLNNHVWAGVTKKTKEQFMEYFNQKEKECQFCKDVGIKKYNSNTLYIYHGKIDSAKKIIEDTIPDKKLHDIMLSDLEELGIKKINALFCYIDNGFRDAKKDSTFLIYKKEFVKYNIKKTNKFIDERDEYNDLKYIGNFSWD